MPNPASEVSARAIYPFSANHKSAQPVLPKIRFLWPKILSGVNGPQAQRGQTAPLPGPNPARRMACGGTFSGLFDVLNLFAQLVDHSLEVQADPRQFGILRF